MNTAACARALPQHAGELSGERPPLIAPGEYQLRLTHWDTAIMWGRSHKVALHFQVCSVGEYFDTKLVRYYNVERIVGKPTRHGKFKVRWNQDLVRDYCRLLPAPSRLDRIDLARLTRVVVIGSVRTVSTTSRQRPLAPVLHYSVVSELLRVEAGNA